MVTPSRWSSGVQWGPPESSLTQGYWQPYGVPTSGRVGLYVAINAALGQCTQASWSLGRDDWFDVLAPRSASFSFVGSVDAMVGDPVLVTTETGILWTGTVDTVVNTKDTAGNYWSSVSATDVIGRLGLASGSTSAIYNNTLDSIAPRVIAQSGILDVQTELIDSGTPLPTLDVALVAANYGLLEYLNLIERSSNAMMFLQRDGVIAIVTRDNVTEPSVTTIDMSGLNSPSSWETSLSKQTVINHWVLTSLTPGTRGDQLDESYADSIEHYGESTYEISDMGSTSIGQFPVAMRAALTEPRTLVTRGEFPIYDVAQDVLLMNPLTWITDGSDTWQVMSVSHDATPGGAWRLTIAADVSQNWMASAPTPDPDPVPIPGVSQDTQTRTSTKSATVALSGSNHYGNGAGDFLAVGLWQGVTARALIDFTTFAWPAGFIRVRRATLHLRTSGQAWVGFGNSPKFYVQRIAETWSQGTYDAPAPNQYSTNSSVWPGANSVTGGRTLKSISDAENHDITVDVTDIMQDAYDSSGHAFNGFKLISHNESSKINTIEFFSDNHANPPQLVVVCDVS